MRFLYVMRCQQSFLTVIPLYEAGYPRVTHPSATKSVYFPSENFQQTASFDLHVLSTPPAFILSQDQTLILKCLFSLFRTFSGLNSLRTFQQQFVPWFSRTVTVYKDFFFVFKEARPNENSLNFQGCFTVQLSRLFVLLLSKRLCYFIITCFVCQALFSSF